MKNFAFTFFVVLCSCSVQKKTSGQKLTELVHENAVSIGQTGICVFNVSTQKFLYQYNADKYFTPASNVKLFSLYAGLKYLGDSLPGLNYFESNDTIYIGPTGDPTLLHPYFNSQPVIDFLSKTTKYIKAHPSAFNTTAYGKGWAWDDYNESFMNERSALPVYGNNIIFNGTKNHVEYFPKAAEKLFSYTHDTSSSTGVFLKDVQRDYNSNHYHFNFNGNKNSNRVVPFITSDSLAYLLLEDTLHKKIQFNISLPDEPALIHTVYSRPVDSLFIPMMFDSDNFFAEQTLLMVSNKRWNSFNETKIIDSLLLYDLKDIPQKPRWVDGSGLSRYNLFTPKSFVHLLNKMKDEFGLQRMESILPTGGQGTLKNYYLNDAGYIFAKTGSMSNNCSISGYLLTKKKQLLIFSILNNHFIGESGPVKRSVEKFLHQLRENN